MQGIFIGTTLRILFFPTTCRPSTVGFNAAVCIPEFSIPFPNSRMAFSSDLRCYTQDFSKLARRTICIVELHGATIGTILRSRLFGDPFTRASGRALPPELAKASLFSSR